MTMLPSIKNSNTKKNSDPGKLISRKIFYLHLECVCVHVCKGAHMFTHTGMCRIRRTVSWDYLSHHTMCITLVRFQLARPGKHLCLLSIMFARASLSAESSCQPLKYFFICEWQDHEGDGNRLEVEMGPALIWRWKNVKRMCILKVIIK